MIERCKRTEAESRRSGFARHQGLRRTEHDLSTSFCQNALALPFTHQAVCCKYRDVRLVGQLFIPDIELNSFCTSLAHAVGKVPQHLREPLAGILTTRRDMDGPIRCEIVIRY